MYARTAHEQPYSGTGPKDPAAAAAPTAAPLHLDWIGKPGAPSCAIEEVWRDPKTACGVAGVFVIWIEQGALPVTLYVGNGRDVGVMLAEIQGNPRIVAHAWTGALKVSWAAVASMHRPGVARYLADTLLPMVGEATPAARTIPVNLPA